MSCPIQDGSWVGDLIDGLGSFDDPETPHQTPTLSAPYSNPIPQPPNPHISIVETSSNSTGPPCKKARGPCSPGILSLLNH